jgi:hypothetical protein
MKNIISLLISLIALIAVTSAQAVESAGKIGYMSGTLVAQRADGTIKVMVSKSDVLEGDVLVTAKDSYAQVVMNDGAKMTLRPDSNLKIDSYKFSKSSPQTDSAIFRLLKGGFRTVTGLIGKRGNPDAFRLQTTTATIGVRGTDFTTRLCVTLNCQDEGEAAKPARATVSDSKAVGRVMLIEGGVDAVKPDGGLRKLILGSPVYEGDTLKSAEKSDAVVVFRDGGRITLQTGSVFQIEQYKYDKAAAQENAILRLLKGGVRVVTGLIGRTNHDNYKFNITTATIGIRGTGFDAWCNGPCADGSKDFGATLQKPLEGAGVFVWSGEVALISPSGTIPVALNQAAIIARESGKPVQVLDIPDEIKNNIAPKPNSVPVDLDKLFKETSSNGEPGLYVTVNDGQVILAKGDQKIDLGVGESGFADDHGLARLNAAPGFMRGDKMLENLGGNLKHGSSCVVE